MRLGNFVLATVVGLASLGVSIQPSKAQSFPECHQNSRQVGDSYYIYLNDSASVNGSLEVQLRYCDNDQSNFGRVIFHAGSGSFSGLYFSVERLAGPDGPGTGQVGSADNLSNGQSVDTPILYAPNNQARICVVYYGFVCTAYH